MQYLKRLTPQVAAKQNSTANTIYVDKDDETIKVGSGASGTTERTLLTTGSETNSLTLRVSALGVGAAAGAAGTVTTAGNVIIPSGAAFVFSGSTLLSAVSDGIARFTNNAGTGFTRLIFGANDATTSGASWKLSSGSLSARKGDDSADIGVVAANFQGANGTNLVDVSDGIWRISNGAANGFTRLILGTNDASGVAVKKNGTQIDLRLGNDSGFCSLGVSNVNAAGTISSVNGTATPAGGSAGAAVLIGSAAVGIYIGTGAPSVSAAKGSIYTNTTATTTTTRLYVNTDGGTTWTNLTTAA